MKLIIYILFVLLFTSCGNRVDVSFFGKKIAGIKKISYLEDEVVSFNLATNSGSTLQSCSFEYTGVGSIGNDDCSTLRDFAFNSASGAVSWTTDYGENGTYKFNITTTINSATQTQTPTVEVKRKNRNPVITNTSPIAHISGQNFTLALTATDPDIGLYDDILTYRCISCPTGMVINNSLSEITYNSSLIGASNFSFTIEVRDQYGGSAQKIFAVNVSSGSTNVAPVLSSISNASYAEDDQINIQLAAIDSNGDSLSYSFSCSPVCSGATIDSLTGAFSWKPDFSSTNTYAVSFGVTDGVLSHTQNTVLTITNKNRAPVLATLSDVTVNENNPVSILLSATDPDADTVSYSYSCSPACPAGVSFNTATGAFGLSTDYTMSGDYAITFTASDNYSPVASSAQTINLRINNVNRAPNIIGLTNLTINENDLVDITLVAVDPDGNNVSFGYSCNPACPGASFNTTLGTFQWQTDYASNGTYNISFTVIDDGSPPLITAETITVNVGNVNRIPTLAAVSNRSLIVGQTPTPTISLVGSDLDAADVLTYEFDCVTCTGATIDATTGVFSWSPPGVGTFNVTFRVRDAVSSATRSATITVSATNNLPVFAAIKDRVTKTQEEEIINFSTTDADGDSITYTCHILDINLPGNEALEVASSDATCASKSFLNFDSANARLTFNTLVSDVGFYRVLLRANDTKEISETRFNVSVNREIMELVIKPDYNGSLDYLLPVKAKVNKKYIVDWGDLTNPQTLSGDYPTHTFLAGSLSTDPGCMGCTTIRIGGQLDRIHHYGAGPDSTALGRAVQQLYKVESIGDLYWVSLAFGFSDCANLISVKTGFVSNTFSQTQHLFDYNTNLVSVDFNGFNASSVLGSSGFYNMFNNTPALRNVSFTGINSTGVKNFGGMFSSSGIETVELSPLNFSGAQNFRFMFAGSNNLVNVDFSNVVIPNVVIENLTYAGVAFQTGNRFEHMFNFAQGDTVDFSNAVISDNFIKSMFRLSTFNNYIFTGSSLTVAESICYMFSDTGNLINVDFSNSTINAKNFTDGICNDSTYSPSGGMFNNAFVEGKVDFTNATLNMTDNPARMFQTVNGGSGTVDFEGVTINSPTITNYMFYYVDIGYIDFSDSHINVSTTVNNMFYKVTVQNFDFSSSVVNIGGSSNQMFNEVRKGSDAYTGRVNNFYFADVTFTNTFNTNPLTITNLIYNSHINNLDSRFISFTDNVPVNLTNMLSSNFITYANFEGADFRFSNVSNLNAFSNIGSLVFPFADLSTVTNLSTFLGSPTSTEKIIFKDAIAPNSISIQDTFNLAQSTDEIDLSFLVGKNIGTNISYLFRGAGEYSDSASLRINLASSTADGFGNYPSIDISTVTDSSDIFLDTLAAAVIYCDYDSGPGFGTFFGKACTNPALYVP